MDKAGKKPDGGSQSSRRLFPESPVKRLDEGGRPVVRFQDLAGESCVVLIELGQTVYQLRRTRNGKLILNR